MYVGANNDIPMSIPVTPMVPYEPPMSVTVTPPVPYYPPTSVAVTPPVALTSSQQRQLVRAGINPITGEAISRPLSAASLKGLMPWFALGGAGLLIYMMMAKRGRA